MGRQTWLIFIFITSSFSALCQIEDDFSSDSGEIAPAWEGNLSDFIINDSGQLQLFAGEAGTSSLYQSTIWEIDQSWEIEFLLDFNPSANNRLDIYLWADSSDLSAGSGLILRIGENGSQDAITLYNQEEGRLEEIGSGTMGLVALGPVSIRIRVFLDSGMLVVTADSNNSGCFVLEIESLSGPIVQGSEFNFGIVCQYTSTRKDKFFFDNVYVGPFRKDTFPISIISSDISQNQLVLILSEPANVETSPFFSISPDPGDINFELQKGQLTVGTLSGFEIGTPYTISLIGIEDLAGNILDTILDITRAATPQPGSLLINEVLFNPEGSGADFIEIFNASGSLIDVNGLVVRNDQNGEEVLLRGLPNIEPDELFVVTTDREDVIRQYPQNQPDRIYRINLPRMANDDGDMRLIFDGIVIDDYDYSEDHHHPLLDDVDGVSLERISVSNPGNNPANWTSALKEVGYGTPGLVNSIHAPNGLRESQIALNYTVFSPNNDGHRDQLEITYSFNQVDYVGDISLYNDSGHWIKDIRKNERFGSEGILFWDGTTHTGELAPIGIYIIFVRLISPNGARYQQKLTCGLGDFLD